MLFVFNRRQAIGSFQDIKSDNEVFLSTFIFISYFLQHELQNKHLNFQQHVKNKDNEKLFLVFHEFSSY